MLVNVRDGHQNFLNLSPVSGLVIKSQRNAPREPQLCDAFNLLYLIERPRESPLMTFIQKLRVIYIARFTILAAESGTLDCVMRFELIRSEEDAADGGYREGNVYANHAAAEKLK